MFQARSKIQPATHGFTLIEILVAILLLGMLGAGIVTTLNSTITAKEKVDLISDRFHLARQAMERMNSELSMAYLSQNKNVNVSVSQTSFKGEKDRIAFDAFGHVPYAKNAKESDQREISFFLEADAKTGRQSLMRKIHSNITAQLGKEGRVDVLCPDVKSLSFKYWNVKTKSWTENWSTEGIDQQITLPPRVLIEFVANIENEVEQKFMTETEIWLTQPIKFVT